MKSILAKILHVVKNLDIVVRVGCKDYIVLNFAYIFKHSAALVSELVASIGSQVELCSAG